MPLVAAVYGSSDRGTAALFPTTQFRFRHATPSSSFPALKSTLVGVKRDRRQSNRWPDGRLLLRQNWLLASLGKEERE
ncbi:hypothetical protein ACLB2K_034854 [Fragaria x ananassa]